MVAAHKDGRTVKRQSSKMEINAYDEGIIPEQCSMGLKKPSRSGLPYSEDNRTNLVVRRCHRGCDNPPKGLHERLDLEVEFGQVVVVAVEVAE